MQTYPYHNNNAMQAFARLARAALSNFRADADAGRAADAISGILAKARTQSFYSDAQSASCSRPSASQARQQQILAMDGGPGNAIAAILASCSPEARRALSRRKLEIAAAPSNFSGGKSTCSPKRGFLSPDQAHYLFHLPGLAAFCGCAEGLAALRRICEPGDALPSIPPSRSPGYLACRSFCDSRALPVPAQIGVWSLALLSGCPDTFAEAVAHWPCAPGEADFCIHYAPADNLELINSMRQKAALHAAVPQTPSRPLSPAKSL